MLGLEAKRSVGLFAAAVVGCCLLAGCAPSGGGVEARGSILSADGVVLAQTEDPAAGHGTRSYPLGEVTSPLVGSCYTADAPDGIEQVYADELLADGDIVLTVDSGVQQAAFDALGDRIGAAVVLDSDTGAVLAMVSTPAYDPAQEKVESIERANRATELHIPGSTFKTITLAAALESGSASVEDTFPAPAELTFPGGSLSNYDLMQYPDQTLVQAYAKSINTVFAQLALQTGMDAVSEAAERFGFGQDLMDDFPVRASLICGVGEMDARMQAWTGVGQALYQMDGELQGPLMSAVQGAVMASVVQNGGVFRHPHVVAGVRGEMADANGSGAAGERVVSEATAAQLGECMRAVVKGGTGRSAAVEGVDVAGKTGTAETASGADDGWFIGFAQTGSGNYSFAVLVEGAEGAEASSIAARIVEYLA